MTESKVILQQGELLGENLSPETQKRLAYLKEIGYLDFLRDIEYTPLTFADGRVIFVPIAALPPGLAEGDSIEIIIRRVANNE